MKRTLFTALCCTLLLLSSCWDARELSDIGIVVMTGFDLDDDGQERVTVLSVQPFGNATDVGEAATTWIGTASGKSAFEAMRNLRRISTRKLVFAHNKIFLIGEDKAKQGIANISDVVSRTREFRYDTTVFLTNGRAEEMMHTPADLERSLFRELLGMIDNSEEWSKGYALDVKDFSLNALVSNRHGYVIGNMGFLKKDSLPFSIDRRQLLKLYWKETTHSIAYIAGGGVIHDNRLIGWLTPTELQGYMIISNQIKGGFTLYDDMPAAGYEVTVDIIDLKTEITFPEVSEDEIRALVKVKCTAELQETDGVVPIHDAAVMEEVEEQLSNELISELILVVRRAQNELRSDFIGFHKQFSIAYPKQWKELEENWCEVFSNIAIAYDVDVKIMRQGLLYRTLSTSEK